MSQNISKQRALIRDQYSYSFDISPECLHQDTYEIRVTSF